MMKKCKLTILKTTLQESLAKEYGVPNLSICPLMKEGQVFYPDGVFHIISAWFGAYATLRAKMWRNF